MSTYSRVAIGALLVAVGVLLFLFANHELRAVYQGQHLYNGPKNEGAVGMLYIGSVGFVIVGLLTAFNIIKKIVPDD